ncbi:MAG: hypothetical protein IPK82_44005 [Polyangiaceae bacterium]|nr:hypothetical protein [Polyangiaceae bacterium]
MPTELEILAARSIQGLRLDQYAGICAALSLGFSVEEALANDAIPKKVWQRLAPAWAVTLAKAGQKSALYECYLRKTAEATAWVGRKIKPLEESIEAWIGFLNVWTHHKDPAALLAELSIQSADLTRIQALWGARIESNIELQKVHIQVAARRPHKVPPITVIAGQLRPFPWSKKRISEASQSNVAPKAQWTDSILNMPDVVLVTPSFMRQGVEVATPAEFDLKGLKIEPASTIAESGTLPVFDLRSIPLPFKPEAPSALARPGIDPENKAAEVPSRSGETVEAFELKPGLGAPFQLKSKSNEPVETVASFEIPKQGPLPFSKPAMKDETVASFEIPKRAPLPFANSDSNPPLKAPVESRSPVEKKPSIGETVMAFELPKEFRLPFAAAKKAPEPQKAPQNAETGLPAAQSRAAPPRLSVEQHASFHAELAAFPSQRAEVLKRYHLSQEAVIELDRFYQAQFVLRPELRPVWQHAYRVYTEWLQQNISAGGRRK